MGVEFRLRDYRAEERACSLPRRRADTHPLSAHSPSALQVKESGCRKDDFVDPLRATDGIMAESSNNILHEDIASEATAPNDVSGVLAKGTKGELDDSKNFDEEDDKVVSQQECLSKLLELKDEINQSWLRDDRVTSLRLSIKVARLLMDASIIQFYPTLFVLATDMMDMLGDLVWARIKQKAEITEEGRFICSLPVVPLSVPLWQLVYDVGYEPVTEKVVNQSFQERIECAVSMTSSVEFCCNNFKPSDVCFDAKETCNNWLSKVGSVRELLPRIYLELAILPCWRFLHNHPENNLQRLVMMVRGIADPLASAYCRLYLVQCAQRLPQYDTGFLITCINDLKLLLMRLSDGNLSGNSKLLLTLVEPTIEYIIRCLFKDRKQMEISISCALGMGRDLSTLFENCSCISIFLHYILKELPIGYICFNAMEILHLIECTDDNSFDQGTCLNVILGGIFDRLTEEKIGENGLMILQSIFLKLLAHFANIVDILALNHFLDILDMLHGRNSVNMQLLSMATRQGHIQDPTIIEVLLEVAQALYDGLDFSNMRKDDYQHPARVISDLSYMVAILGGFISHVDGLINAAINCLQSVDSVDGVQTTEDVEGIISLICKLCGILVMVPGSLEQGGVCIPKRVVSFLDSQPWVLPRMKTKVLCMVVFLSAALSQNQFLYHAISGKVIGNYQLFYGVRSYHQEVLSFSGGVLQDILNIVMQEPSTAVRGKMALEACNCVASSFKMCGETIEACSKLVEIAKACSPAGDRFLQSTLKFLDAHQFLV
ncbi:UNVERIFIED_CONTAM: VPS35 endosomal protein sorting factor-like [Sesamum angustifolium]|uniref:VPS35 endosomal protein sorting factor-like n=1 Tax=Sesamum angustifolium TaxID=2727405 RepID=A0AAW2PCN5_9LAMI